MCLLNTKSKPFGRVDISYTRMDFNTKRFGPLGHTTFCGHVNQNVPEMIVRTNPWTARPKTWHAHTSLWGVSSTWSHLFIWACKVKNAKNGPRSNPWPGLGHTWLYHFSAISLYQMMHALQDGHTLYSEDSFQPIHFGSPGKTSLWACREKKILKIMGFSRGTYGRINSWTRRHVNTT